MDPDALSGMHPCWRMVGAANAPWIKVAFRHDIQCFRGSGPGPKPPAMICGPCSSAMDVAFRLHREGVLTPGAAVLAIRQASGRGRMGRSWASPPGNLYAAWIRPAGPAHENRTLSLLICAAIVRVLESFGLQAFIKWPNDVLMDGRKIGGILTEEKGGVLAAGIGLNLYSAPHPRTLTLEGALPAACLKDFGRDADPAGVWEEIVKAGGDMEILFKKSVDALTIEAERRLAWLGETVRIISEEFPGDGIKAVITGLGCDGTLKIEHRGRKKYISSYERIFPVSS